jgi:DNA polymerase-3 subunit delta'
MNLIGHEKILKILRESIKKGKLVNSYLFFGPESVGKKEVAIDFISEILAKDLEKKVKIKEQILKKIHPDVYFVEKEKDKKTITIDQIRELQNFLNLKSFSNFYKIGIIIDAENASISALNSLLKTLEEPPSNSIIILIVNNLKTIPKTIISRCQLIKFKPVPLKEIKDYLISVYKLSENQTEILARLSFGKPGLAIRYIEDEFKNFESQLEDLYNLLNASLFSKINFINKNLDKFSLFVFEIILRDVLLVKNGLNPLLDKENINFLVSKWSEEKVFWALKYVENLRKQLRFNINKRLALEYLLINL